MQASMTWSNASTLRISKSFSHGLTGFRRPYHIRVSFSFTNASPGQESKFMVLIHFDVLVITSGHVELVGRHCFVKIENYIEGYQRGMHKGYTRLAQGYLLS